MTGNEKRELHIYAEAYREGHADGFSNGWPDGFAAGQFAVKQALLGLYDDDDELPENVAALLQKL